MTLTGDYTITSLKSFTPQNTGDMKCSCCEMYFNGQIFFDNNNVICSDCYTERIK